MASTAAACAVIWDRKPHILVNNAGVSSPATAEQLDMDDVIRLDEINFLPPITLPQPSMDAGWGYVKIAQKVNAAPLALAAVLADPSCGLARIAVGSAAGVAVLPEMAERWMAGRADRAPLPELSEIEAVVAAAWPQADPLLCAMAAAALQRALAQAAT